MIASVCRSFPAIHWRGMDSEPLLRHPCMGSEEPMGWTFSSLGRVPRCDPETEKLRARPQEICKLRWLPIEVLDIFEVYYTIALLGLGDHGGGK